MNTPPIEIVNPSGTRRVVVTKPLPGSHWLEVLTAADCRVEILQGTAIHSREAIAAVVGARCDGVIGQLTENWDAAMFAMLGAAGVRAYSNYAVGYNNVDVAAATAQRIPVGNTPGVLTETTAEHAVALTFAASRRIVEADRFMRDGHFSGCDSKNDDGKNLPGHVHGVTVAPEGYQVDVDCVQHQLNAQQDGDSVAPRHHTEQANAKECSRKI